VNSVCRVRPFSSFSTTGRDDASCGVSLESGRSLADSEVSDCDIVRTFPYSDGGMTRELAATYIEEA